MKIETIKTFKPKESKTGFEFTEERLKIETKRGTTFHVSFISDGNTFDLDCNIFDTASMILDAVREKYNCSFQAIVFKSDYCVKIFRGDDLPIVEVHVAGAGKSFYNAFLVREKSLFAEPENKGIFEKIGRILRQLFYGQVDLRCSFPTPPDAFINIETLILPNSGLKNINFLKHFVNLRHLDLSSNLIRNVPILENLEYCDLSNNSIENIGRIDSQVLLLNSNKLKSFASEYNYHRLCLCKNPLRKINCMTETLDISGTGIESIQGCHVKYLIANNSKLSRGCYEDLEMLFLENCNLTEIKIKADKLRFLSLRNNLLSRIPYFPELIVLDISKNLFNEIPRHSEKLLLLNIEGNELVDFSFAIYNYERGECNSSNEHQDEKCRDERGGIKIIKSENARANCFSLTVNCDSLEIQKLIKTVFKKVVNFLNTDAHFDWDTFFVGKDLRILKNSSLFLEDYRRELFFIEPEQRIENFLEKMYFMNKLGLMPGAKCVYKKQNPGSCLVHAVENIPDPQPENIDSDEVLFRSDKILFYSDEIFNHCIAPQFECSFLKDTVEYFSDNKNKIILYMNSGNDKLRHFLINQMNIFCQSDVERFIFDFRNKIHALEDPGKDRFCLILFSGDVIVVLKRNVYGFLLFGEDFYEFKEPSINPHLRKLCAGGEGFENTFAAGNGMNQNPLFHGVYRNIVCSENNESDDLVFLKNNNVGLDFLLADTAIDYAEPHIFLKKARNVLKSGNRCPAFRRDVAPVDLGFSFLVSLSKPVADNDDLTTIVFTVLKKKDNISDLKFLKQLKEARPAIFFVLCNLGGSIIQEDFFYLITRFASATKAIRFAKIVHKILDPFCTGTSGLASDLDSHGQRRPLSICLALSSRYSKCGLGQIVVGKDIARSMPNEFRKIDGVKLKGFGKKNDVYVLIN